jgi:DNA-3-methyladenine glycosylase
VDGSGPASEAPADGSRLRRAGFPGSPRTVAELAELLAGPSDRAAAGLLGCRLSSGGVTVRLTEVEAYAGVGADPASHTHRGPTKRNAAMFGPPGHAYVYFTYGMHWCVNVVCRPEGEASAVLLRAGEVVSGVELAETRRPRSTLRDLARGPARLTQVLAIDGSAYGTPLLTGEGPATLAPGDPVPLSRIRVGPRVGVTGAAEVPWRFWLAGPDGRPEPTVSAYRPHVPRRRD